MDKKTADIVRCFMHTKVHRRSRLKFLEWLASSDDASEKEAALRSEWMGMADVLPDRSVLRSWRQVRRKAGLAPERAYPLWRKVVAVAAACAVIIVSSALAGHYLIPPLSTSATC